MITVNGYLATKAFLAGVSPPMGLVLCPGENEEHVDLMQLDRSDIHVAEYLTELPSREVLQSRLHQAIQIARQNLIGQQSDGLVIADGLTRRISPRFEL